MGSITKFVKYKSFISLYKDSIKKIPIIKNEPNNIIKNKEAIMKKQRKRGILEQILQLQHLFFESFKRKEFSDNIFSKNSLLSLSLFLSSLIIELFKFLEEDKIE